REDAEGVWLRIARSPCFGDLHDFPRRWLALFRAVGARDIRRMAEFAAGLLATDQRLGAEPPEYLLMAAMAGQLTALRPEPLRALWGESSGHTPMAAPPACWLLRPAAEPASCPAASRPYAER